MYMIGWFLFLAAILVLVGIAYLRGKCDGFIAGYNTASPEKKKQYDIKLSINWTFCPQNGLSVTQVLPKSPFLTHWLRLCNILRRSVKETGRKAT